jgi:hypothetical protein
MSVSLQASDEIVITYLKSLWNNPKPSSGSLIQTLIDNKIIGNPQTLTNEVPAVQEQVEVPAVQEQVNEVPAFQEQVNEVPAVQEQVEVPAVQEQVEVNEVLAVQEQVNEVPAVQEQVNEVLAVQEQVNEVPAVQEQVNEVPSVQEQVNEVPAVQEQVNEVPSVQEQVNEVPAVQEQVPGEVAEDNSEEDSEVPNIEIDMKDKTKFKTQVRENLKKIREIGFRVYHNVGLEKEVNLNPSTVTNNEINQVYNFKAGTGLSRNSLMKDICRCTIFPKYKSGDVTKPENFRYLVNHHNAVKIINRIWCMELIQKCGKNIPDNQIYKANLVKSFSGSIINTAVSNTQSIDNVVLIDISRAFDSLEWDVLENLLLTNLTRKINSETAKELVEQYMTIIKNRELYYNGHLIEISKGIPTGLPSSNLVFTLALEEILFRWLNETGYKNDKDFIMNVYVDDIYLKIKNTSEVNNIVNSLIKQLSTYQLNINKIKSKADESLKISTINVIKNTDYYLGIPFTRDIKLYGQLVLNEFKTNKMNLSWGQIYDKLNSEDTPYEEISIIIGFMNYKLRPFLDLNSESNENSNTIESNREKIKKFIFDKYVQKDRFIMNVISTIIVLIAILVAFLSSQS